MNLKQNQKIIRRFFLSYIELREINLNDVTTDLKVEIADMITDLAGFNTCRYDCIVVIQRITHKKRRTHHHENRKSSI